MGARLFLQNPRRIRDPNLLKNPSPNYANPRPDPAPTSRYELGAAQGLFPIYIRGQAYLQAKRGADAAAEFQKIVDRRGIAPTGAEHSLAKLGLGRAYRMTGDTAKARAAYQDFLALWKDADPDIPILKEAKAEYNKLK